MLTFFDFKACQLFLLGRDPAHSHPHPSSPSIQDFESTSKLGWLDLLVKHLGQILSFATFACSAVEKVETLGEVEKGELRRRFERVLLWSLKRLLDSRTFVCCSLFSPFSPPSAELNLNRRRQMGNNEPLRLFDAAPTLSVLDPEYNWLRLAVSATESGSPYADLALTASELQR